MGKLDRSFGEGGRVLTRLGTSLGTSNFRAAVRQSDGKLLIGAEPSTPKGGHSYAIQRRNSDGSLDVSFGEGAGSIEVATLNGLALQPDGRILVANASGSCSSSDALRRFLPSGARDLTFGPDGVGASVPFEIQQVVAQADGKIVVAGTSRSGPCGKLMPSQTLALARYNPDGTLDSGFGVAGLAQSVNRFSDSGSTGLAVADGGRIVITTPGSVLGVTANGALDTSFGDGGGIRVDGSPFAPTLTPEGKLLVGVNLSNASVPARAEGNFGLARYTADGSPDTSFGTGGKAATSFGGNDEITALAVLSDGAIVLGGSSRPPRCTQCTAASVLARFDAQGKLDPGFGSNGHLNLAVPPRLAPEDEPTDATIYSIASSSSGRMIVATGTYGSNGGFLASVLPAGAIDADFGSGGFVFERRTSPGDQYGEGVAVAKGGAIYVTAISSVNATGLQPVLIRYEADGELDRSFGNGDGFIRVPSTVGQPQPGRGGSCYLIVAQKKRYFVLGLRRDGSRDPSFGEEGLAPLPSGFTPGSFAIGKKNKILIVGRQPAPGMVALRLTRHGRPDRSFGQAGLTRIPFGHRTRTFPNAVGIQSDGRIVLAGRADDVAAAARLMPNGEIDRRYGNHGRTFFSLAGSTEALEMLVLRRGAILTIAKHSPSGVVLARLNQDGGRLRAYGRNGLRELFGGGGLIGVANAGSGRIVTAEARGGKQLYGVRLHAYHGDGTVDRTFGRRGLVSAGVNQRPFFFARDMAIQPKGGIVIVGTAGRAGVENKIQLLRFR